MVGAIQILKSQFHIDEVAVSGPPWNMTVAVRFHDSIGNDYKNEGAEWLRIRRGRVSSIQVFLDTERITAWESRDLEQADSLNSKLNGSASESVAPRSASA